MANTRQRSMKDQPTDEGAKASPSPRSPDETTSDAGSVTSDTPVEDRENASASGIPADDPDAGEERKRLYKDGATLVSRID